MPTGRSSFDFGFASAGYNLGTNNAVAESLKGIYAKLGLPFKLDAFRSHSRQNYAGEFELLFGVSSLEEPAAAAVRQLQTEFPDRSIRLIECPERLGTNGKVSTLIQMVPHARHEFLLSTIPTSP